MFAGVFAFVRFPFVLNRDAVNMLSGVDVCGPSWPQCFPASAAFCASLAQFLHGPTDAAFEDNKACCPIRVGEDVRGWTPFALFQFSIL